MEFRDGLCLRYGIPPQDLPTTCLGCLDKNSIEHSLIFQKGGRIIARHNNLRAEWASLCRDALSLSAVETKPLIHYGQVRGEAHNLPGAATDREEEQGDVGVHSFWDKHQTMIFDVRIGHLKATSYQHRTTKTLLCQWESEKKGRYA